MGGPRVVELSQAEAARLPFRSRYPSSKLVAWLLAEAGVLRPLQPLRVLDLTYGQGIWWHAIRGRVAIAGLDVRRLNWVVKPRCFILSPAQEWRGARARLEECLGGPPDLVAVDPPWQECIKGNGCQASRRHYRVTAAIGSPESILEAAADAARAYRAPLLVHFRERWVPEGLNPVIEVWWKPFLPNVDKYGYRNWWAVLKP